MEHNHWRKRGLVRTCALCIAVCLSLTSCASLANEESDDSGLLGLLALYAITYIPVSSAADLASASSAVYDDNRYGLITGNTLQSLISNWPESRPAGITGKLIILQLDAANGVTGDPNLPYITPRESAGVFVYELDAGFRFNQVRSNGLVLDQVRYQADGPTVDNFLKLYNINLATDLVVFAVGTGRGPNGYTALQTGVAKSSVQDITRAWYWLRYWGADKKNLAVLNGNIRSNIGASFRGTTKSTPPNNGTFSVRSLRVHNTILHTPTEDVITIVRNNLTVNLPGHTGSYIIVDARPTPQFNLTAGAPAGQNITASANDPARFAPFEGHLKGAVSFPWVNLLDNPTNTTVDFDATGYRYKSKADLEALFAAAGYTPGKTVLSQCRSNFEAQVNGFASIAILGQPTVYFDGSFLEWTALVSKHPTASINQLPASHPWTTDTSELTGIPLGSISYNLTAANVVRPTIDPASTTTRLVVQQDQAYKQ